MKSILLFLAVLFSSTAIAAEVVPDFPEKGMVPNHNMLHIGIVVRDIEAARDRWGAFLGIDELPNIVRACLKSIVVYRERQLWSLGKAAAPEACFSTCRCGQRRPGP